MTKKGLPTIYTGIYLRSSTKPRPNFYLRSSRISVDLLSYESKPTEKLEQNNWRSEKNLDGKVSEGGRS